MRNSAPGAEIQTPPTRTGRPRQTASILWLLFSLTLVSVGVDLGRLDFHAGAFCHVNLLNAIIIPVEQFIFILPTMYGQKVRCGPDNLIEWLDITVCSCWGKQAPPPRRELTVYMAAYYGSIYCR